MHKIYFVLDHIKIKGLDQWLKDFVSQLRSYQSSTIQITSNPHDATVVIFMGSGIARSGYFNSNHIKQHYLYQAYPDRCFIWCTEDQPLDYLPGLYASLPKCLFNSKRHKTFIYYHLPTSTISAKEDINKDVLYSFVGGATSEVRRKLFDGYHGPDTFVKEKLNFNHGNPASESDKTFFAEILQRSYFTLCPRGVGASSYRLFEAMRFGSVPVIISDQFVLPDGPDWSKCSIRVAEQDIHTIREVLEQKTDEAEQMSKWAKHYYDLYFSEENILSNIIRLTSTISMKATMLNNLNFYKGQILYLINRINKRVQRL